MTTATYTVTGMTCAHCVASVSEEVSELAGVTDVAVELESGTLTISGDGATVSNVDAVRGAVEEAGYQLVTASPREG
jgi:copper chaperone